MGLPSTAADRVCEPAARAGQWPPSFARRLEEIRAAEHGAGWLAHCADCGLYLALTRELVKALAEHLAGLGGTVAEVGAGAGRLAQALNQWGIQVVATDPAPQAEHVLRMGAGEALQRLRPAVVLASFLPVDSGADEQVMSFPSVRHYLVLGARLGGVSWCHRLFGRPGWTAEPVPAVARWMLTRHDVWTGDPQRPVLQHGEAWHFRRQYQAV